MGRGRGNKTKQRGGGGIFLIFLSFPSNHSEFFFCLFVLFLLEIIHWLCPFSLINLVSYFATSSGVGGVLELVSNSRNLGGGGIYQRNSNFFIKK